ncbi:MAG: formylglycine-generating enzyme family protein [Leptospiraceae bacterium]|nr:formylglycine-generating enzyme family protein [Leptospiraceae bacterium]
MAFGALMPMGACQLLNGEERPYGPACADLNVPADMRCIEGGPFLRGSERESINEDSRLKTHDESPVETIIVHTFFMDTTEVTYGAYQRCVQAGGCSPARPNYTGYSRDKQPMLGANWFQARQFCNYYDKRLATEAEWEFAARGPHGDLYPWGNEPATCERAIIKENDEKGCGTGVTWDVASRPVERNGLYDMAGNSWEWVNDWYSESYAACGLNCQGSNPQGPCNGADECPDHKYKVVRGGSWWWDAEHALSSNRRPHFPSNQPFHHFGFRCAKSVPVTPDS